MKIANIKIKNFRGISEADIYLNGHTVIIGDNNAGKSTIFEAIDLVLGPDRLNRIPVVDEHDFFNGKYYNADGDSPVISVELVITDLGSEQLSRFKNHLEFWDILLECMLPPDSIDRTDSATVKPALRLKFIGKFNVDDDDFEGDTFFCWPEKDDNTLSRFGKGDKRECGFLYLRALRTGARALSMERGSLLDIILRIREIRPKMWEAVLSQLKSTDVAVDPELGIKNVLENVQDALKEFVPSDWGSEPILRVSDLTREHLRKTLTIFMSTGAGTYHAPFHHQGTGTINTMVLALLSMIAETKMNVIFAMEEPEIAIPPYTQKRIVDSIRRKSTQAIFTSHSPFVLEEFSPHEITLIQRSNEGVVSSQSINFPTSVKPKNYSSEFRLRFAEALLAKRILLAEGTTETTAYPAAGRRLNELDPGRYPSLEGLGVAIFNAESETAIAAYGKYFTNLGKVVFAVCDKQTEESLSKIKSSVSWVFESSHKGFEDLLAEETSMGIIKQFCIALIEAEEWPESLNRFKPGAEATNEVYKQAIKEYLMKNKGDHGAAELLGRCVEREQVPITIRNVILKLKKLLVYQAVNSEPDELL